MTTLPFSRRQEHERDCWHVQDLAGQLVARWPDPNGSIQIHHARTSDIRLVPLPEACAHSRKAFCFDFPAVEWVRFVNLPLIRGATSHQLERLLAWRPRINWLVMHHRPLLSADAINS
jgi:hypothetical protein